MLMAGAGLGEVAVGRGFRKQRRDFAVRVARQLAANTGHEERGLRMLLGMLDESSHVHMNFRQRAHCQVFPFGGNTVAAALSTTAHARRSTEALLGNQGGALAVPASQVATENKHRSVIRGKRTIGVVGPAC